MANGSELDEVVDDDTDISAGPDEDEDEWRATLSARLEAVALSGRRDEMPSRPLVNVETASTAAVCSPKRGLSRPPPTRRRLSPLEFGERCKSKAAASSSDKDDDAECMVGEVRARRWPEGRTSESA